MNDEKKELSLTTPVQDLENRLLTADNPEELKTIIDLFNLNIKKKDIIRTSKLNSLQDKVYDQMEKRLEKNSDEFSNKDLLDYYKTIQDNISKYDVNSSELTVPKVQLNQININSTNELSRESKQKVADAVMSIINGISEEEDDQEIIEEEDIIDNS